MEHQKNRAITLTLYLMRTPLFTDEHIRTALLAENPAWIASGSSIRSVPAELHIAFIEFLYHTKPQK